MKVAMVNLTIDGQEAQVAAGTTVLNAAEAAGIHIPRLCYDPSLSSVGACRLCVVEIEGIRNLPASCVTAVMPGMVVRTGTPAVIEARKTVLELLIANHPLDCLTCEKLGDCKLAEYCYLYGIKGSSFKGETHSYDLEDDNPFIVRDLNKCIVCGKCVRACAEVTGKNILDFANRGFNTKVTPFGDISYSESDCIFCGNCVSYCPVGALTEKQMWRKGRRFELKKVRTTCTFCGAGCNFNLCVKDGKVVGVTSNPDSPVNANALCIRGRFATRDFIHSDQRLTTPLIRKDGQLVPATWDEALDLVAERFKEIRDATWVGFLCSSEFGTDHQRGELPGAKICQGGDGHPTTWIIIARTCHAARGCEDPYCEPISLEFTHVTLLRCQNNTQGASDMGALAGALPGYQRISDQAARSRFESAWGVDLPEAPGLTFQEMFAKANEGYPESDVHPGRRPGARRSEQRVCPVRPVQTGVPGGSRHVSVRDNGVRRRGAPGRQLCRDGRHLHQYQTPCPAGAQGDRAIGGQDQLAGDSRPERQNGLPDELPGSRTDIRRDGIPGAAICRLQLGQDGRPGPAVAIIEVRDSKTTKG